MPSVQRTCQVPERSRVWSMVSIPRHDSSWGVRWLSIGVGRLGGADSSSVRGLAPPKVAVVSPRQPGREAALAPPEGGVVGLGEADATLTAATSDGFQRT